jgi:hypothetical protein
VGYASEELAINRRGKIRVGYTAEMEAAYRRLWADWRAAARRTA